MSVHLHIDMFLNLLLFCFIQYVFSSERSERLLLNDPSLIMDRLTQLENTVIQQSATIQTQSAEIRQLQKAMNSTVGKSLIKQSLYNK